jgi:hypothetical protein
MAHLLQPPMRGFSRAFLQFSGDDNQACQLWRSSKYRFQKIGMKMLSMS